MVSISPLSLQRVATPDKLAGLRKKSVGEAREARDYRLLWQNAIKQQIMLGRMERENARMLENEEQLAERRLKLDYQDLRSDKICGETWERILSKSPESVTEEELRTGVSVGTPQARRGEAWHLLTTRPAQDKLTDSLVEKFPNLTAKYNSLKSQLTSHRPTHADWTKFSHTHSHISKDAQQGISVLALYLCTGAPIRTLYRMQ